MNNKDFSAQPYVTAMPPPERRHRGPMFQFNLPFAPRSYLGWVLILPVMHDLSVSFLFSNLIGHSLDSFLFIFGAMMLTWSGIWIVLVK
ncbi:hypothetical protein V8F20_009542 [Naviculisporaceae sp. PSN 640]